MPAGFEGQRGLFTCFEGHGWRVGGWRGITSPHGLSDGWPLHPHFKNAFEEGWSLIPTRPWAGKRGHTRGAAEPCVERQRGPQENTSYAQVKPQPGRRL